MCIRDRITSYQNNMAASSEQVVSHRENVMQAQKAVQIAGKRYEVGKGTVLEPVSYTHLRRTSTWTTLSAK